MISTVDDLIEALGGTGTVAKRLGVRDNTVSTWRGVRGLPAWACRKLEHEAASEGLNVDPSLFDSRPRARNAA